MEMTAIIPARARGVPFQARADAGRELAEVMYDHAVLLTLADGVEQDRPTALVWLKRAAAHGLAKAEDLLGSFHELGWACPRNLLAAAQCYARAAHGGDHRGCFNHARMLAGKGRVREALPWLERAGTVASREFLGAARDWLAGQDDAELRVRGVAALDRGAAAC